VQIDADGQHDVAAIAKLASEAERFPHRIVCGQPVYDDRVPVIRFYARYLSLAFNWLETLSLEIRDAQCGFRIYPVRETLAICERARLGSRMDFDPEILVRARWAGLGLRFVPVRVSYPETGASHYRYLRDNLLITWMHIRLIAGMLLRLPRLLARTWAERRSR
jgi:hypothetical protein